MGRLTFAALAAFCCFASGAGAAPQQADARVSVVREGDRDLERTAFRLRIPAAQLRQARNALQEATQIVHDLDPDQIQQGSRIPSFWIRLDRRRAVQTLESLLNERSRQVVRLENGVAYGKLLRWAVEVASVIAELDPSRALKLVESWPAPYEWMGDSATDLFDQIHAELASDDFSRRFSQDARQAMSNLLRSKESPNRYRDGLSRIRRTQDEEEANRMVDRIVSQLGQVKDPRQAQRWTALARRAANLPHDRFSELLEAALLASTRIASDSQQTTIYEVNGNEVALNGREYRILQTLQGFIGQPEALMNALGNWPDANEVVTRLGGLDRSLRASAVAVHRAGEETRDYRANRRNREESSQLFQELKANTFSRPWWVRQRLKAIGADSENGFEQLTQLLPGAVNESPELAELVLDLLQVLVDEPDDPQTRLSRFARFADFYPRLEGKLTPEQIRKGFRLLEEVEELPPDGESSSAERSTSANIESFLMAEWALHDFESALNEVRRQESSVRRLQFLTAITQRLSGQRSRFRVPSR